jgi:hypothetical protein
MTAIRAVMGSELLLLLAVAHGKQHPCRCHVSGIFAGSQYLAGGI